MRIAFVGKGGSGKSTLTSAFIAWLSHIQKIEKILIIDADHNQHIRYGLGKYNILPSIFDYQRYITHLQDEIRTSLPKKSTDIIYFRDAIKTIELAEIGKLDEDRIGSRCYHGQIGEMEVFLNHFIDTKEEWIISDMTAGSDILGSSYFSKFDVLIGVCEPTYESMGVIQEIYTQIKDYKIPLFIIGNKVSDREDEEFLLKGLSEYGGIKGYIPFTKIRSQKDKIEVDKEVFQVLWKFTQNIRKNWKLYQKNLEILHEKNRTSWAENQDIHGEFKYKEAIESNSGGR